MHRDVYFRNEHGKLFTKREVGIATNLKRVIRSKSEIIVTEFGRYESDAFEICFGSLGNISTKEMQDRKVRKQMIACGLI